MASTGQRTVLYLEDESDLLAGWTRLLSLSGLTVLPCRDLSEAFSALQTEGLSAVLCDFQLGMGTSLPLIQAAAARRPPLPVVLMTGNRQRAELDLAAAGIVLPILSKPATLDAVLCALVSV